MYQIRILRFSCWEHHSSSSCHVAIGQSLLLVSYSTWIARWVHILFSCLFLPLLGDWLGVLLNLAVQTADSLNSQQNNNNKQHTNTTLISPESNKSCTNLKEDNSLRFRLCWSTAEGRRLEYGPVTLQGYTAGHWRWGSVCLWSGNKKWYKNTCYNGIKKLVLRFRDRCRQ